MDSLTALAASGLRARSESLDLLANNLANAGTAGYKSDREFYGLYRAAEAGDSGEVMPVIERQWTDFSQGTLQPTGNALDLALTGRGFFAVNGPSGPLYTRNGNFRTSPGGRLETAEGYPVRGTGGGVLTLTSGRSIEISGDGTVRQDGRVIGQLEIVDFTSTAGLSKLGRSYFGAGETGTPSARPADTAVEQGKLEGANVGTAESAVRLVSVMRQFEMLQKAVTLGSEMNRRAIEEVARVSS
jgi:flagellar basal body rod protein FlgG